jgi:hypothetical protein
MMLILKNNKRGHKIMFFVTELQPRLTRNPEIKNLVAHLVFDKEDDKDRKDIAEKLGLTRDSLTHKKSHCYYVISPTKRTLAIQLGAVEDSMSNILSRINDKVAAKVETNA